MILEILIRAVAVAFFAAILTGALELGNLAAEQTGSGWINAAILFVVIAFAVQNLKDLAVNALRPKRGSLPQQLAISSAAFAAFIFVIHQQPTGLSFANWGWTYPNLEVNKAYHQMPSLGRVLFAIWNMSFALAIGGAVITIYATYITVAETIGLAFPSAWAQRNKEEPGTTLHDQIATLTSNNRKLSQRNEKIVVENTALNSEAERLTKLYGDSIKTEQAFRQELVRASVTLERAQARMNDQEKEALNLKKMHIGFESQLSDALDKIGKQDRYIVLLLERQTSGTNTTSQEQPKDKAGYTQFVDNPFQALVKK